MQVHITHSCIEISQDSSFDKIRSGLTRGTHHTTDIHTGNFTQYPEI